MTRRVVTEEDRLSLIRTGNCYEAGCTQRVKWLVLTASGQLPFCDEHASFYRERGPGIYPVEPVP